MERLDRFCGEQFFYADIAGMCVSAARGDAYYRKAFGYADYAGKIQLQEFSLFPCASIAKLITADLVLDHLEFTDDVVHMLSHTTGISEEGLYLWKPEEFRFSYDDAGYDRLGGILERETGVSYRELAEDRLKAYGMNESSFSEQNVVCGHFKDRERRICTDRRYRYEKMHLPSSGLISNIYDLEILARKFMDDERYGMMRKPVCSIPGTGEQMGLGFFIMKKDGHLLYGHDAGEYGYRGTFWICPELGISIIVLSNHSGAPVRRIAEGIFDILKG